MNSRHVVILALAILSHFLATSITVPAAESMSVLLQKGIYAEETERNLEEAIKIYEGIVKELDANRSVAAQAQYRLGVCRAKQGKREEAAAAFRKIVDQFSDAAELVAKSRERLAELGQPVASIVVRQVLALGDRSIAPSRISPDGQLLTSIDWETGDLWLRHLADGSQQKLTQSTGWTNSGDHAMYSAFSRDGKRIAFDWWVKTNDCYELRVLDGTNPAPRVVATGTNRWIFVGDWSPDGTQIAVVDWTRANREAKEWQGAISLISVADGTTRKVVATDAIDVTSLRFSPDGRYLAYNIQRNKLTGPGVSSTNDIFVASLTDGKATRVIEHVANERFVGWAPHGSEILYLSDRRGTTDLWAARIDNGQLSGHPNMLKSDMGVIEPIGLTSSGAFYYLTELGNWRELYSASVDFATGRVLAAPKLLQTIFQPRTSVSNKIVRSSDGRFVFYSSGEREAAGYGVNIESGEKWEIPNSRLWAGRIGWWWPSPDGSSLLVTMMDWAHDPGLFRVNSRTGEKALFAQFDAELALSPIRFDFLEEFVVYGETRGESNEVVLIKHDLKSGMKSEHKIPRLVGNNSTARPGREEPRARLLPDGHTVLFDTSEASSDVHTLVHHDLNTGKQQDLLSAKARIQVASGADNQALVVTQDDRGKPVAKLFIYEGSTFRETLQADFPEGFIWRGQHWKEPHLILIRKEDEKNDESAERWTFSVRTGELKKTGFSFPANQLRGQGEDKPVVFHKTRSGSREIWVMENFLPPKR